MATVECPWCDEPVGVEPAAPFRCERCGLDVEFGDEVATAELPRAA